jgi:hypothetical protein
VCDIKRLREVESERVEDMESITVLYPRFSSDFPLLSSFPPYPPPPLLLPSSSPPPLILDILSRS